MNTLFNPKQLPLKRRREHIACIPTAFWEGGTAAATPLILLHGLNGSHHGVWPLASRLHDYHLFLPDLPGHGGSGLPPIVSVANVVEWFKAFVQHVAITTGKKPIVIAHSFGAQIAFMSCLQIVGEYSRCILLNPVPRVSILPYIFGKSLALLPKRLALELVGGTGQARYWRGTFLLQRHSVDIHQLVRWIGDSSTNTPDKFAFYVAISQELMDIHAYRTTDVRKDHFYCIAGDADRMLTPDSLTELQAMFGPNHFSIVPNSGHLMPIEAPDDTVKAMRRFLPPAA